MDNETEISQLVESWAQAVRARDIDAILKHHSADMVLYDVPPPFISTGIEAYQSTWDMFFKDTKPGVFTIGQLHIIAGSDVAFCYSAMMCAVKSGSEDYEDLHFRLTIGLQKINGQWTILHEHHSIPA